MPTSRDLLVKHVLHATGQVEHWVKVEQVTKEALAKFDHEKDKLVREQKHVKLKEMESSPTGATKCMYSI